MTENNVNRLKYLPSILVMLSSKRHLRIQKILTKKMLQKDRKKKIKHMSISVVYQMVSKDLIFFNGYLGKKELI